MINTIYKNAALKADFATRFVNTCLSLGCSVSGMRKVAENLSNILDSTRELDIADCIYKQAGLLETMGTVAQNPKWGLPLAAAGTIGSFYLGHKLGKTIGNANAKDEFDVRESDLMDEITELQNYKKIVELRQKAKKKLDELKSTPSRRQLY